jgi:hypothetical protein
MGKPKSIGAKHILTKKTRPSKKMKKNMPTCVQATEKLATFAAIKFLAPFLAVIMREFTSLSPPKIPIT